MTIRAKRFPEIGVTLSIFSGAITQKDVIAYVKGLETAARWVTYFDPTADLSGLDVAHIPEVKRTLAAKLKELHGDEPVVSVFVACTGAVEAFLTFWRSYVADPEYPAKPEVVGSLDAACRALGLSEDACAALKQAAES